MFARRLPKSSSLFSLFLLFLFSYLGVVSSDNTYNISDANEFINFANSVDNGTTFSGATVYLINDIDFSSCSGNFTPVGNISKYYYFNGIFNGQGHTIKNLAVNSSDFRRAALFGFLYGLTIMNVVIDKSCSFSSSYSIGPSDAYVSSIIGQCQGKICCFENVVNMADISYHGVKTMNWVITGGIVAKCHGNCVLSNCVNFGSITISSNSTINNNVHAGGIVGEVGESNTFASIRNCINYGTIADNIYAMYHVFVGGFAGIIWSNTTIENCLSAGPLSSVVALKNTYVGSVIGGTKPEKANSNNTITNCFWTESVGSYNASGEIIDNETVLGITGTDFIKMGESSLDTLYSTMDPDDSHGWVIVHLNGGRIGNSSYDKLIVNKVAKRIPEPAREGSTFKFWCTDTGCSATCDSNETDKCGSKELYAVWDRVNVVFLTFDDNNSTISKPHSFGQIIEYPEGVEKTGHTLSGWDNTTATVPGYDIVVKALWSINNYSVTFDFDNGTEAEVKTFAYNSDVIYLEDPTKEGHSFINWNDTSITVMPAYNLTIKALWIANNYTVTFNATGGTAPSPLKREVTYGEQYGELPETTRTGYTLAGWFTGENGNGESIDFDTNVTIPNNHTLYAYWTINNYTVTFDFDNGAEPEERTFAYNIEIIYPNNPTKEGQSFINWNNTSITSMPAYNLTIKALWLPNNYTVTFDFDNEAEAEIRSFEFNTNIIYPNNPTKEGYIFFGWDNNITVMPAHNLTIKALWEEIKYGYVKVVFNTKDLSKDDIKEIISSYTDNVFEIIEIKHDSIANEIFVIIKFADEKENNEFVRKISQNEYLKRAEIIFNVGTSLSILLTPLSFFVILL